jgi:hypothetical protein
MIKYFISYVLMWFWPVKRMFLRPGPLWLNINLVDYSVFKTKQIYVYIFNFKYSIRCFRVLPKMSSRIPRETPTSGWRPMP